MSGELYYNRRVSLLITDGVKTVHLQGYNPQLKTGYDIDFDVEKTAKIQPNNGKIRIYNLDVELRSFVQSKTAKVILSAGYRSTSAVIFKGNIRYASHVPSGADWVTTIEAGDGERAFSQAKIGRTWKPGTPLLVVVQDLMATFQEVEPGNFVQSIATSLTGVVRGKGQTISGKSADVLDGILKPYGYKFSIQDGKFQFVTTSNLNFAPLTLLSSATGLIGEPAVGEKDENGKLRAKMRALLTPSLLPGSLINVSADSFTGKGISGFFVASKVSHKGSNWRQDFYTDIDAESI